MKYGIAVIGRSNGYHETTVSDNSKNAFIVQTRTINVFFKITIDKRGLQNYQH